MNKRCTINPQLVIDYKFKHLFTYTLFYHIMLYYDVDSRIIIIDRDDIILKYNSNYHSIRNAINELLDNEIIYRHTYYKNRYKINNKVFIKFG